MHEILNISLVNLIFDNECNKIMINYKFQDVFKEKFNVCMKCDTNVF